MISFPEWASLTGAAGGMRLDKYSTGGFDRGRPRWVEGIWLALQALLVSSPIPGSWHRVVLLRLFGASIGDHVRIKPRVLVKFPWRLVIGEWSWVGEGAWIDNLAEVRIGSHVVISQGAYLCTGSHDLRSESFALVLRPIEIGECAWVCARAIVSPGTVVGRGAVVSLGSVAKGQLQDWQIYRGNPAVPVGRRQP